MNLEQSTVQRFHWIAVFIWTSPGQLYQHRLDDLSIASHNVETPESIVDVSIEDESYDPRIVFLGFTPRNPNSFQISSFKAVSYCLKMDTSG